jgi:hypothetical protein
MSPDTVPDWQLERFRLRELPAEEQAAVARALEVSAPLRERLALLDRSDARILGLRPPGVAAERIRRQLREPAGATPSRTRRLVAAAAATGVLVAVWALLPGTGGRAPAGAPAADLNRIKGLQPELLLYLQASPRPAPLRDGALVRARDVIQVSYVSAGRRYGVVVSVDGRGVVTRHLPPTGSGAAELDARSPASLASAFELDDAPRFERFFFVTSSGPFPVSLVTGAVERLAAHGGERLELPPAFEQSTFLLRKDGPR